MTRSRPSIDYRIEGLSLDHWCPVQPVGKPDAKAEEGGMSPAGPLLVVRQIAAVEAVETSAVRTLVASGRMVVVRL